MSFLPHIRAAQKFAASASDLHAAGPSGHPAPSAGSVEGEGPFVFGADLGFSVDYSCLVGIERIGRGKDSIHNVPFGKRWPLKSPHWRVLEEIEAILLKLPARRTQPTLVVDATGLGGPLFQDLRRSQTSGKFPGIKLVGCVITGGEAESKAPDHTHHVPKAKLVGTAVQLYHSGRLRISSHIPFAAILKKELLSFSAKLNQASRTMSYEAQRSSQHDDAALALALACWQSDRLRTLAIYQS